MADAARISVRATINLPKLRAGEEALVDATDPYIAGCLQSGFLIPADYAAEEQLAAPSAREGRGFDVPVSTGGHADRDETDAVVPAGHVAAPPRDVAAPEATSEATGAPLSPPEPPAGGNPGPVQGTLGGAE